MSLTDELQKLAELKAAGQLTPGEFADAKRKLLSTDTISPRPAAPVPVVIAGGSSGPQVIDKTYWSSRWSTGNLFYRDSLTLGSDGILFRKGRMFGSQEERISYRAVASLRVITGMFLAKLSLETSGGSQPIFINGLWKSDAKQIQDAVRLFQHAV